MLHHTSASVHQRKGYVAVKGRHNGTANYSFPDSLFLSYRMKIGNHKENLKATFTIPLNLQTSKSPFKC